jgi:effector-binding domain-containing protein
MEYRVRLTRSAQTPTAVVAASTSWEEFPSRWKAMLDEVWAFLRSPGAGLRTDGHNIMLYKDDVPNVEVGVQVTGPFVASGRVVPSSLPAGETAMTLHRGAPERLGAAHQAVIDWCTAHGLQVTRTRWEIYGDWREDASEFETAVHWLLRQPE